MPNIEPTVTRCYDPNLNRTFASHPGTPDYHHWGMQSFYLSWGNRHMLVTTHVDSDAYYDYDKSYPLMFDALIDSDANAEPATPSDGRMRSVCVSSRAEYSRNS